MPERGTDTCDVRDSFCTKLKGELSPEQRNALQSEQEALNLREGMI